MSNAFYTLKLTFVSLFLLFVTSSNAQTESGFFNALKNNDASGLQMYLQDQVDLCIIDNQQILLKKVALDKISDFLSTNKITNIEVMHKGASKDKSSQYKVAKITTSNGPFRFFVYSTSQEMGPKSVKEIRIDKF